MRRAALLLIAFAAGLGLAAAGCGSEKDQTAAPETVQGSVPAQTTEQETTESQATDTTETTTGSASNETETETGTTDTAPPAAQGDPVAGKAVFTGTSGCTSCHTLADAGSTGNIGPNLDDAKPDAALVTQRVTNGQGVMPPFKDSLTAQQIADVAAYVSSVAGK